MPLADAITFYLAGPIYVTALSVLLLGERVGWRRWTAVLVGFCGVVIALRPSAASFTLPALIALGGSVFYALLMITTRMVQGHQRHRADDAASLSARSLFGALTAPFGWVTPTALRPRLPVRLRRRLDRGAVLHQPLAQARARERRGAVSVFADPVVGAARLAGVRRTCPTATRSPARRSSSAAGLYIFWREQVAAREASFTPTPRPEAP